MKKVEMNLKFTNNDLEEYRKELFNEVQNSEFYGQIIKDGFTNQDIYQNASKFKELIDDLSMEKKIKTYDDCLTFNKFDRVVLIKNGDVIEKEYMPLKPYEDYLSYLEKFVVKDFSKDLEKADYKKVLVNLKKDISEASKANHWIYLHGAVRSGRTYALVAMINKKYINEFDKIVFLNSPKRIKELSDLYFSDRIYFNELMDIYCKADYLVLDDFGSEYKNEIIRDSIVIPLIKERILNNKLTAFSSDFSLDEIEKLYTFQKSGNNIMLSQFMRLLHDKIGKEILTSNFNLY